MMSIVKASYKLLPVWAQNAAVSLFGVRNARLKYGPVFRETMAQLARNEVRSLPELLDAQQAALYDILSYACRYVPYYRQLGCPADDLSAWPILEKHTVKANPQQFISDEFASSDLLTLRTSGTTGSPLEVKVTRHYHQMEMAFRWRHKAWAGIPYSSKGAYLAGHPVVPIEQTTPPFWRYDGVEERLLFSSAHLAWHTMPHYVEALKKAKPRFLHGFPSTLNLLAHYVIQHNIQDVGPLTVFASTETLLEHQRETIERAFGTKVFNWYGNTEMTCNIIQCAAGRLHYRTDYGLLELLDDGTMVCTGLNNRAMPFIRYRVGDRAQASLESCSCGCGFPVIENIEGRLDDYIVTPEGRYVTGLSLLFKESDLVREAQIVQDQLEAIVIRLVPQAGYSGTDEQRIRLEAHRRLGNAMRIHFEYVNHIPREPGGKFRFIKSQLSAPFQKFNSQNPR
jgi:phenylacetate-CoA ligase